MAIRRKRSHLRIAPEILRRLGEELNPAPDQGIVELVKNAYDADATRCVVELIGTEQLHGTVRISDNGDGLTTGDIIDGWLVLGRSKKSVSATTRLGRIPAGNKGLGRVAALRMGTAATLTSRPAKEQSREYELRIDWRRFDSAKTVEDVPLTINVRTRTRATTPGTTITLENLNVPIGRSEVTRMARSLVLLADPFSDDPGSFRPLLRAPEFEDLERLVQNRYFEEADYHVIGKVDRGGWASAAVTDWRGRELWSAQHSDLTARSRHGRYNCPAAEFDFWTFLLQKENFSTKNATIGEVKAWLQVFGGVHLYQNGLRVNPYGNPGNDWLDMNLRRAQRQEERPSTNNSIGRVAVMDRDETLLQKTDRSGFVETEAFLELRYFARDVLDWFANRRMDVAEKRRKQKRQQAGRATVAAKTAVAKQIAQLSPSSQKRLHKAFERYDRTREREAVELQSDIQLYRTLATAGITAATFAHESSGNPLKVMAQSLGAIERRARAELGERKYKADLERPVASMRNALSGLQVLTGATLRLLEHEKRRIERVDLRPTVDHVLATYSPFFTSHDVAPVVEHGPGNPYLRATRAAIESIVTNLLNNAFAAFERSSTGRRIIRVRSESLDSSVFRLRIADSGPGIIGLSVKDIWLPGRTTQENGTGLGLAIVNDAVTDLGGSAAAIAHSDLGGAEIVIDLPILGA